MTLGERLRHEAREIGSVTLYFLTCFFLFLLLKKLLLEEYHVEITIFHQAVIGALVVAKVVVLLDKSRFGSRFREGRPILHLVYRSLCYTAAVLAVTVAERVFDLYREARTLPRALSELWTGKDLDHFLAMNLCVLLTFLVYNAFAEIDRHLGPGGVRRLFLAA